MFPILETDVIGPRRDDATVLRAADAFEALPRSATSAAVPRAASANSREPT